MTWMWQKLAGNHVMDMTLSDNILWVTRNLVDNTVMYIVVRLKVYAPCDNT
jgi:hypothetical protein